MTKGDVLKLKAVVLYILQQCGELDYIHLFKILYFAERSHYAYYGQHLVRDSFHALPKGPVPSFLYDAVKMASGVKGHGDSSHSVIASALSHGDGECQYYYVKGAERPDMDELSKAEIRSLDEAISKYKDTEFGELSRMSHDDAWQAAYNNQPNSRMDSLLIAKSGGASDGFVEYIKEQERLEEALTCL